MRMWAGIAVLLLGMALCLPVGVQAQSPPTVTINGTTYSVSGSLTLTPVGPVVPPVPASAGTLPAGFRAFPATDPWNTDVSAMPVAANSAVLINSIGTLSPIHPNFGTIFNGAPNGTPFNVIDSSKVPFLPIGFDIPGESDPGPYPIPTNPLIEAGGDAHLILVDPTAMKLWEVYQAALGPAGWHGFAGAFFNLATDTQRPAGFTSADAAGLPIFPGLVRFDEVQSGTISHALRFTAPHTRRAYLSPANHFASVSVDPTLPPMGLRVRLKATVDTSTFSAPVKVICAALKKYGMILADNGGVWFVSGEPNSGWNDTALADLKKLHGSDLEVVDTGAVLTVGGGPNPPPPPPIPPPVPGSGVIFKVVVPSDPTFTAIFTATGGSDILVSGMGFGSPGTLTVAGLTLVVKSWTDTVIVGTLPAPPAAGVTGPLVVTPGNGPAVTSKFTFTVH